MEGRKSDAPLIRPNKGAGRGDQNPPPKGNVSFSNQNRGDIEAGFKKLIISLSMILICLHSAAMFLIHMLRLHTGMMIRVMIRTAEPAY